MLYFDCVSVFHIFIIIYCMLVKYKDKDMNNVILFLPSHIQKLLELIPNIQKLSFIKKIYIIDENYSYEELDEKYKDIIMNENDIVHMLGWSKIGIWLNYKAKQAGAKTILIEEIACGFQTIEYNTNILLEPAKLNDGKIHDKSFNEIWKYETKNKDINALEVYLESSENFQSFNFRRNFLNIIDEVFDINKNDLEEVHKITFFDHYIIQVNRLASKRHEKCLLKNIINVLKDFDYIIKPHPGTENIDRYPEGTKISKLSEVPQEIITLHRMCDGNLANDIKISFGMTGAISNDVLILGNCPYVIFLNKLLYRYGISYIGDIMLDEFLQSIGYKMQERIFFPETFLELRKILERITGGGNK